MSTADLVADTVLNGSDGSVIGKYELVEKGIVRNHPSTFEKK